MSLTVHIASERGFGASSRAEPRWGRSRNIAVVTPFITRLFYSEVIDGVESALIGAGCDLTPYRLKNNSEQRKVLSDYSLVRKGVDAAIALTLFLSDDEVQRLRQLRKPVWGCGGFPPPRASFFGPRCCHSQAGTQHLIDLGHRHLVHVGGDQKHQLDFEVHSNRLKGLREAHSDAVLAHHDNFLADACGIAGG
jgi:DNA-binding LacI/PurR family transcriptional regulator